MKLGIAILFAGVAWAIASATLDQHMFMRIALAISAVVIGFEGGRDYGKWEMR